eukprot:CAMPEP_0172488654 /NCGR_PEP_ID=MMETSP1066-20121228/18289_1 /TAXON_ID=671091 /ORGANISM="Coscinodiscus wailesii, Strain CCMP2513" /LENGTH=187 /DNA_ID=CAMNT_0013256015 /DNA_START=138 /DNA_END=701 /DNA_ORIENTATION=+
MYQEFLEVIAKTGARLNSPDYEIYDLQAPRHLEMMNPIEYGQYYNKYWEKKIEDFVSNDLSHIRSLNAKFDRVYAIRQLAEIIKHEDASMVDPLKNYYLLSEDVAFILFQDFCKGSYTYYSARARFYENCLTKTCKNQFRDIFNDAFETFGDTQDRISSGSTLQGQAFVDRYREVMIRCPTNSAEAS